MQIQKQFLLALAEITARFGSDITSSSENTLAPHSGPPAIVLWHGLGDNYDSGGLRKVSELVKELMPETFVHSVFVDEDPSLDERRSLFGNANNEVDLVCEKLSEMEELKNGFGAIGFSQGGLFMRALIERCPSLSVSTLITFGSPHMGVSELPMCPDDNDWVCKQRNALLKRQVWQKKVQESVIPAQYFRDLNQYDKYLEYSSFLADVNNERDETYSGAVRERFEKLQKLVLIMFGQDTTLVPKESAFFQELSASGVVVSLTETTAYRDNLFGLRTLHEQGKVDFYTVDDVHMRFSDEFFVELISKYFLS